MNPVSTTPAATHVKEREREREREVQTHHTASQPPRHKRKPQKQHQLRLPRHARPTIRVAVRTQSALFDRIDYQHPQRAADAWDPVDERHVGVARVGGMGEDGAVEEGEEAEGELCVWRLVRDGNDIRGVGEGREREGEKGTSAPER